MYKRIKKFKNLGIYLLVPVFAKLINFFLLPLYSYKLMPEDYAVIGLTTAFIDLWAIFLLLQIGTGVMRIYVEYENENKKLELMGSTLIFLIGFSVSLTIIANIFYYLFYDQIVFMKNNSVLPIYFLLATLSNLISQFIYFPLMFYRLEEKANHVLYYNVFFTLVLIGLNVFFILFLEWGLKGYYLAALIASIFGFAALLNTFLKFKYVFKIKEMKEALSYSLPTIPGRMAQSFISYSDRYFLAIFVSTISLGLYQFAAIIVANFMIFITSFESYFYPKYFQLRKGIFTRYYFHTIYLAYFVVFIAALIFISEFMYFVEPKYFDSLIFIFMLGEFYFLRAWESLVQYEMQFFKFFSLYSKLAVWLIILSVAGNYIFIQQFEVYGAVLAGLSVQSFLLVYVYRNMRQFNPVLLSPAYGIVLNLWFMIIVSLLYWMSYSDIETSTRVTYKVILLFSVLTMSFFYFKRYLFKELT